MSRRGESRNGGWFLFEVVSKLWSSCFFYAFFLLSCTYLYCSRFIKWRHFLLENDLTNLLNENENYFLLVKWFLVFTRNTRVPNNFRTFAILDFYQSYTYVPVANISSLKQLNSNIFFLLSVSNRLLASVSQCIIIHA